MGRAVLSRIQDLVGLAELNWRNRAGDLGGAAVSEVWEALDQWVRSGTDADPEPIFKAQIRRKVASHAAAAQAGIGTPRTSGLVALVRERAVVLAELPAADQLAELDLAPSAQVEAPRWMRVLAVMLDRAGWDWPMRPEDALIAAVEQAVYGHRRARSSLSRHWTGVPAGTWSALELLVDGSAPSCRIESAWVPPMQTFAIGGGAAVRSCREVQRLVSAAVTGNASRTGKDWRKSVFYNTSASNDQVVAS